MEINEKLDIEMNWFIMRKFNIKISEIFFQTRIHVRGLWLTCNLLPKQTQFVTGFKLLEYKVVHVQIRFGIYKA